MDEQKQERAKPLPGIAGFVEALGQMCGYDDDSPVGISALYYPAVGFLLGAAMVAVDSTTAPIYSQPIPSMASLLTYLVVTRARAVRGLARTLARAVDRRLATATPLTTTLQLTILTIAVWLLASIDDGRAIALLYAPMLGACSMVVIATGSREARADGKQVKFSRELTFREFGIASTVVFAVVFLTTEFLGLVLVLATGLLTIGLRLLLHWRPGGIDRDSMHGAGLVVMLAVLAMMAAF